VNCPTLLLMETTLWLKAPNQNLQQELLDSAIQWGMIHGVTPFAWEAS
jgi:hypothetical protein